MIKKENAPGILLLTLLLLVASCGGGDDGDDSDEIELPVSIFGFAPTPDGSGDIFVMGSGSTKITRLNSDGTVDPGFDTESGFKHDGYVSDIALVGDGNGDLIVVGDFEEYNGKAANKIVRLNSDGSLDRKFDSGSGFLGTSIERVELATDGSGDVYVGGYFTEYNGNAATNIIRLNSDGTVDTGFDTGSGFNHNLFSGFFSMALATDGSGDVYVGGGTEYNGNAVSDIIRLNSDGTLDAGFDTGSGTNSFVTSIASTSDGSDDVYVVGAFSEFNGNAGNNIMRLNSDGTVDADFDVGSGLNRIVYDIALVTDGSGDVYVGGYFTEYNGNAATNIIRLNSDGTVDTGFDIGLGFTDGSAPYGEAEVFELALATDGSGDIYVMGFFTEYNGNAVNDIVRLNSDGTLDADFDIGS